MSLCRCKLEWLWSPNWTFQIHCINVKWVHLIWFARWRRICETQKKQKMDECLELKFISFSFPCNFLNLLAFFFFFSWQSSVRHHFVFIAVGISVLRTYFPMFFFLVLKPCINFIKVNGRQRQLGNCSLITNALKLSYRKTNNQRWQRS